MACARSLVRRARGTRLLSGYAAFLLRRLREAALCAPRAGGPRASGSLASCSPSGRGGPGPRLRRGPSTTAETPARSLSPGLQSSRARGGSGARSGSSLGRASKGVDGGRGKGPAAPGPPRARDQGGQLGVRVGRPGMRPSSCWAGRPRPTGSPSRGVQRAGAAWEARL